MNLIKKWFLQVRSKRDQELVKRAFKRGLTAGLGLAYTNVFKLKDNCYGHSGKMIDEACLVIKSLGVKYENDKDIFKGVQETEEKST